MTSMPDSSGSFSSISIRSAWPFSPKSSLNMSRKFSFTWAKVSLKRRWVSSLILSITSIRFALELTRSS